MEAGDLGNRKELKILAHNFWCQNCQLLPHFQFLVVAMLHFPGQPVPAYRTGVPRL